MGKAIKKAVEIEFTTFDEFVEFGKNQSNVNSIDGKSWSFNYKGHNVTHENDECYLIPTLEGTYNFTPLDVLITGVKGEIYPCKIDIFEVTYNKDESSLLTRLIKEKEELENKLDKLDEFLMSEKINSIDDTQRALLQVQATVMNSYHQILKERIQRIG